MKEINIAFEYDGMPLKTGNWLNCLVAHERGWCGIVTNEKYNDAPEVEVQWYGHEKTTATPRTSMIFIRPFTITLYDEQNKYKCSKELVEWLHVNDRMFHFTLGTDHFRIEAGVAYPINFKS